MKLNDHFKKLEGKISLNPTREAKIDSAYTYWKDEFEKDDVLKDILQDFFQQGSYATRTAIKPIRSNGEFDIDAVLLLNLDEEKPKEVLDLIAGKIKNNKTYKDKVKVKDRCVRIDYAGEFHMDIVPAKKCGLDHISIPCKAEDEWQETNPEGFTKWFKEQHSDSNYMLQKVVKLIKYWRDEKVGNDTAPKSILLTTLVAKNFKWGSSQAESLVLTLENLSENLDSILNEDNEPYVENPSLPGENLARDWNKSKYDIFKTKLCKFAKDSRDAIDEDEKEKSIEKWQQILPEFPSNVEESKAAEDIKSGVLKVNSIGNINTSEGKSIPNHRFYGGV
ncbi:SMODS domain-containing nucleotidyltransferase [Clostridium butyricum]|uniref:SMODS domain-containing nucleotidyltransferase n=1 Tax=Clostridium butyricum TaxID=1492 RepID=UPI002AB1602E|nr:hypothetical protein [Clostridium butyricum]